MRWIFALAAAVWIAGASLAATVFVPTEFREIVADAMLIVRGRVTDVRPIAVPATGVESIVTVGVETVLKGAANGFVSLRVPGGDTGRFRHVMLGAPVLRPGERAVFYCFVFLFISSRGAVKWGLDNFFGARGKR